MQKPTFLITTDNITVIFNDGTDINILSTDARYEKAIALIEQQQWDALKQLCEPEKIKQSLSTNNFEFTHNAVYYKGKQLTTGFAKRLLELYYKNLDVTPMMQFFENLINNPSYTIVDELYDFITAGALPLTPDGHFLAYKKIQHDWKDIYSGKIDHSIGTTVEMPRNQCDDNRENTCSTGLHFCSKQYLNHYGSSQSNTDRVVIVKINPADVVAIPPDYNLTKGRACRYEVIDELTENDSIPEILDPPEKNNTNNNHETTTYFDPTEENGTIEIPKQSTKNITIHIDPTEKDDVIGSPIDPNDPVIYAKLSNMHSPHLINGTYFYPKYIKRVLKGDRKTTNGYRWIYNTLNNAAFVLNNPDSNLRFVGYPSIPNLQTIKPNETITIKFTQT